MKHTPGPWTIGDENNYGAEVEIGDNGLYCSLTRDSRHSEKYIIERDELLANAHLIAAAPDLLSALKEALPGLKELNGEYQSGWDDTIDRVEQAIKKATGE